MPARSAGNPIKNSLIVSGVIALLAPIHTALIRKIATATGWKWDHHFTGRLLYPRGKEPRRRTKLAQAARCPQPSRRASFLHIAMTKRGQMVSD